MPLPKFDLELNVLSGPCYVLWILKTKQKTQNISQGEHESRRKWENWPPWVNMLSRGDATFYFRHKLCFYLGYMNWTHSRFSFSDCWLLRMWFPSPPLLEFLPVKHGLPSSTPIQTADRQRQHCPKDSCLSAFLFEGLAKNPFWCGWQNTADLLLASLQAQAPCSGKLSVSWQ